MGRVGQGGAGGYWIRRGDLRVGAAACSCAGTGFGGGAGGVAVAVGACVAWVVRAVCRGAGVCAGEWGSDVLWDRGDIGAVAGGGGASGAAAAVVGVAGVC